MQLSEVKFCKNCQFFDRDWLMPIYSMCKHPNAVTGASMVTGKGGGFCSIEREYGKCGKEAKNFVPRK